MSRIDNLIKEKCPNGVKLEPLWKVTTWDKKFNAVDNAKQPKVIKYHYYLANDLKPLIVEGGDVKILTTNTSDLWTTEDLVIDTMADGEVVAMPWGGNPNIQYYKGKFITSDNRIATSNDTSVLDNKYLYYFMNSRLDEIASFYRGSGIKHPNMAKVLDMRIPVPPLEVQCEIVRILDNFAELTAELTAELSKRKKQYEYYRDLLLNFNENNERERGVRYLPMSEVVVSLNTGLNPRNFFKLNTADADNYYVTIREMQNGLIKITNKTDRINDEALKLCNRRSNLEEGDVLFSGTGTIGETVAIDQEPKNWNIKEGVYAIKPKKDEINSKYLSYILRTDKIRKTIFKKVAGGTVKSIKMADLRDIVIPVPKMEWQEYAVSLLDKFDSFCNSIFEGLPAEISAREKQYAYYRDKLLTFEEAK